MNHAERKPQPLTPKQAGDVIEYYRDNAHESNWDDSTQLEQAAIRTTLETESLLPPDENGRIFPMLTKGEKSIGLEYLKDPAAPPKSNKYYAELLRLIDDEGHSDMAARAIIEKGLA